MNVPAENFKAWAGPSRSTEQHDQNVEQIKRILAQPPRAAVEDDHEVRDHVIRWWKQIRDGNAIERAFAKGSMVTAAHIFRESRPEIARELYDLAMLSIEVQP